LCLASFLMLFKISFSTEFSGSTTLINSGSFIVRNSLWGINFLRQWWDYSNRQLFSDQEQFDLLYSFLSNQEKNKTAAGNTAVSLKERVVILDASRINTDPPAMTKQTRSNQVLHLMVKKLSYLFLYCLNSF
jgi:hypothetical protein